MGGNANTPGRYYVVFLIYNCTGGCDPGLGDCAVLRKHGPNVIARTTFGRRGWRNAKSKTKTARQAAPASVSARTAVDRLPLGRKRE